MRGILDPLPIRRCAVIRGVVDEERNAVIPLAVRVPAGAVLDLKAVIDTGFNAALSLPAVTVAAIDLPLLFETTTTLADGTVRRVNIHRAELEWDGHVWGVLVLAMGEGPLVGMRLLAGHRLMIDVEPGGAVEITALS